MDNRPADMVIMQVLGPCVHTEVLEARVVQPRGVVLGQQELAPTLQSRANAVLARHDNYAMAKASRHMCKLP